MLTYQLSNAYLRAFSTFKGVVDEQRLEVLSLYSPIGRMVGSILNFPNPYLIYIPVRNLIVPISDYIESVDLVKGIIQYTQKGWDNAHRIYLDFTNEGFRLSIGRYLKSTFFPLKKGDIITEQTTPCQRYGSHSNQSGYYRRYITHHFLK